MAWRQSLKLAMLPVSCAIQAPEFGEIVPNDAETLQQTLQHVRSTCGFWDVLGGKISRAEARSWSINTRAHPVKIFLVLVPFPTADSFNLLLFA